MSFSPPFLPLLFLKKEGETKKNKKNSSPSVEGTSSIVRSGDPYSCRLAGAAGSDERRSKAAAPSLSLLAPPTTLAPLPSSLLHALTVTPAACRPSTRRESPLFFFFSVPSSSCSPSSAAAKLEWTRSVSTALQAAG